VNASVNEQISESHVVVCLLMLVTEDDDDGDDDDDDYAVSVSTSGCHVTHVLIVSYTCCSSSGL